MQQPQCLLQWGRNSDKFPFSRLLCPLVQNQYCFPYLQNYIAIQLVLFLAHLASNNSRTDLNFSMFDADEQKWPNVTKDKDIRIPERLEQLCHLPTCETQKVNFWDANPVCF